MNNDYKQINEMKDFVLKDITDSALDENGEIMSKIKNGKKRIVNIISHKVTIIGSDGKILFCEKLDENHPIICNAIRYYKFYFAPRVNHKVHLHYRLLDEDDKKPTSKVQDCEEIYRFK